VLTIDDYMKDRLELLKRTKEQSHSSGILLNKNEINAERKLYKLRDELFLSDPAIITGKFHDKVAKIKASKIYEALNVMPKPAIHHLHFTASAPIDFLIKLTYYDHVYFNERENVFKVTKNRLSAEGGFIPVNTLRKHWSNAVDFDNYLKEKILLSRDSSEDKTSHCTWLCFQPKFMLANGNQTSIHETIYRLVQLF
jgi:hypothetical protein